MPLFNDNTTSLISSSHPGFVVGRYYASTSFTPSSSLTYFGTGYVFYAYFFVSFAQSFDALVFQNSKSLSSAQEVRLAIYTVESGLPSKLVTDLGKIIFTSVGFKQISCSVYLRPGWYAVALQTSPNSVVLASSIINLSNLLGQINPSVYSFSGFKANLTYGTFPSVASQANLTEADAPTIWLKAS
ncbi:hypothetical protein OGM63_05675 [Plectonema radiosum NIES-515]|uniref:Uncharacterized protein n=1 Tax=Plectonema radiosum NIES-515 TaxID=2986073 RepID=A0ABT3AV93_9CYAN|nr:hypothetical protein [Plectonema radiosum]MCV3213020.1 hypothetical protein [Plectonema radiosum NIES-515]